VWEKRKNPVKTAYILQDNIKVVKKIGRCVDRINLAKCMSSSGLL
jgi:hypothetical protein